MELASSTFLENSFTKYSPQFYRCSGGYGYNMEVAAAEMIPGGGTQGGAV